MRNRTPLFVLMTVLIVAAGLPFGAAAAQDAKAGIPLDVTTNTPIAENGKSTGGQASDLPPGACAVDGERDELLVKVSGLKSGGGLRLNLYSDNEEEFLEKGKKLERIDIDAAKGDMIVCLPVPGPGTYALVVFHDRNGNGKVNVFKDGFGFSNNPKIGLRKPKHHEVAFEALSGRNIIDVEMDYVF